MDTAEIYGMDGNGFITKERMRRGCAVCTRNGGQGQRTPFPTCHQKKRERETNVSWSGQGDGERAIGSLATGQLGKASISSVP